MRVNKDFFDILRTEIRNTSLSSVETSDNSTSSIVETIPQKQDVLPDILQTMQDIQNGKIDYRNVNWELQIKTVLKLCNLMPTKFPYIIWLWGFLGEIQDPTLRMGIIGKMEDVASNCFDSSIELKQFTDDCACIRYICLCLRTYNLRNDIKQKHHWTDERKSINDLANLLVDEVIDARLMVAIAEEMYRSIQDNEKHYMLTLVLRANRNIGKLTINNIVDFVKNLYIAEGFRQLILEGKEDSLDVPTLADFNWRLRNACFDVYIDLRMEQIKVELERDNTRVDEASEMECYKILFEEESAVVNRENGLEQFRGSAAYHAMWYPGRQLVLDMLNVFIPYLQKRIDKEIASKESNHKSEVHLHIEKVENLALGDNVQQKIVYGNE